MASFFHQPILAVVYISSMFLMVSSINVYKVAAPTTKDVNDPQPPFTAGPAACPGPPGIPGPPGAQGPAGVSGPRGNRGFDGNNGYDGDTGPAGPAGASGPEGDKGDDGIDGTNGTAGLKGEKGDQGSTGNQGSKGDPGTPYTPPPTIAFVAHLTTHFHVTSGAKVIDFQTMKLNIGDDFSPTTGVFTCRIPGLYYFAYNLFPYTSGSFVNVNFEHNGVAMGRMYITGGTDYSSARVTSSYSTILALDKGDEVQLRAGATTDIVGDSNGFSTFTGYLLQET